MLPPVGDFAVFFGGDIAALLGMVQPSLRFADLPGGDSQGVGERPLVTTARPRFRD